MAVSFFEGFGLVFVALAFFVDLALFPAPGFGVIAGDFLSRLVAAQRFRCASAIRFLASGLKMRFAAFAGLDGLVA